MIVVAESGSTKTHWSVLHKGQEELSFTSIGINPYINSREEILTIIEDQVFPPLKELPVSKIYYYGAGCSTPENCFDVHSAIKTYIKDAEIEVQHDLFAAARALHGNEPGIAMILGTGSNSCVYNGKMIVDGIPSLGFILGDEGSGAHLGKQLVRDFLYLQVPLSLTQKLVEEYQLSKELILNNVYKKPSPNRWLATFAPFIRKNLDEDYMYRLVKESFNDFFVNHIAFYQKFKAYPLGAVGSIAYFFQDVLKEVAEEHGFNLTKVVQSPMKELVNYHLKLQENWK